MKQRQGHACEKKGPAFGQLGKTEAGVWASHEAQLVGPDARNFGAVSYPQKGLRGVVRLALTCTYGVVVVAGCEEFGLP